MNEGLVVDVFCDCANDATILSLVAPQETTPIACALAPGDLKARIARIRNLAARSLHRARRESLRVYLTYGREAAKDLRELVRKEPACCAFMQFNLQEDAHSTHVAIFAPENARAAAKDLFSHFAPELAKASTSMSVKVKEAPS